MARGKSKKNSKQHKHCTHATNKKKNLKASQVLHDHHEIVNYDECRVPHLPLATGNSEWSPRIPQSMCPVCSGCIDNLCCPNSHDCFSNQKQTKAQSSNASNQKPTLEICEDREDSSEDSNSDEAFLESESVEYPVPKKDPSLITMLLKPGFQPAYLDIKVESLMNFFEEKGQMSNRQIKRFCNKKDLNIAKEAKNELYVKIGELVKLQILLKFDTSKYADGTFNECDFEHFYNQKLDDGNWTVAKLSDDNIPRALMLRKHVFMIQMYKQDIKAQMKRCKKNIGYIKSRDRAELLSIIWLSLTVEKEAYTALLRLLGGMEQVRLVAKWGILNLERALYHWFELTLSMTVGRKYITSQSHKKNQGNVCEDCSENSVDCCQIITKLGVHLKELLNNFYKVPSSAEFQGNFDHAESVQECKRILMERGYCFQIEVSKWEDDPASVFTTDVDELVPEKSDAADIIKKRLRELRLGIMVNWVDGASIYDLGPIKESLAYAYLDYNPKEMTFLMTSDDSEDSEDEDDDDAEYDDLSSSEEQ